MSKWTSCNDIDFLLSMWYPHSPECSAASPALFVVRVQAFFVIYRGVLQMMNKLIFNRRLIWFCFTVLCMFGLGGQDASAMQGSWADTVIAKSEASTLGQVSEYELNEFWNQLKTDFPVQCDWVMQDAGKDWQKRIIAGQFTEVVREIAEKVVNELNQPQIQAELKELSQSDTDTSQWIQFYEKTCHTRRTKRLKPMLTKFNRIVFAKHSALGGSHYAYTEGQSDAQHERHFVPGSSLCVLEMDSAYAKVRTLLEDDNGVIRDPDVSYDGKRILFAWKKSDREDDYHLYEMEFDTGKTRQLTFGKGVADYEGTYLPNGDIVFNSTRCVQTVDCWFTEVSNLYTCDKDGKFLRRLSFDQVHTNYPAVLDDGRVIYTKWEYNDRGQIYPQPLFQMNYDGTAQTEFYGNNSYFPTSILHARGIPGTQSVIAIASGHHSIQAGKLITIDPSRGRQENTGVKLIAPVRDTPADRIDKYGQLGELFQYPYAISDSEFLVGFAPQGWTGIDDPYNGYEYKCELLRFGIYFMTADGKRELLTWDKDLSCNRPVPLARRTKPDIRPSTVDHSKDKGVYYLQDVYAGPGLKGVKRGSIKKLRVVAIEYRVAGIGYNTNGGDAGGALVSMPIAIGNGTWDVKAVLGQAKVYADGSAFFEVPARVPVYFQAVDDNGFVAATMRSWSTLQPGELFSCVGCHENKNEVPRFDKRTTLAMKAGPQQLDEFYGPSRAFSFIKEIQPILDDKCVSCHNDRALKTPGSIVFAQPGSEMTNAVDSDDNAFSLLGDNCSIANAKRKWSDAYLALTLAYHDGSAYRGKSGELVNWISAQSAPSMLLPYSAGSAKSKLISMLVDGHADVRMTKEEIDKISCWIDLGVPFCGDYLEANAWSDDELEKYEYYLNKRKAFEAIDKKNIEMLLNK